jgi:hypothetical protein
MGATRVIAVDLNRSPEKGAAYQDLNPYEVGVKAIRSLQLQMTKMSMSQADIEISPQLDPTVLLGVGTLAKKGEGKQIIEKGYKEAKKVIKCIKEN